MGTLEHPKPEAVPSDGADHLDGVLRGFCHELLERSEVLVSRMRRATSEVSSESDRGGQPDQCTAVAQRRLNDSRESVDGDGRSDQLLNARPRLAHDDCVAAPRPLYQRGENGRRDGPADMSKIRGG